jgi:cell division protein FtsL
MAAVTNPARATVERDIGLRVTPARPKVDERPALRVVPAARRRRWGILATAACAAVFAVMLGLTTFQARIAADQLQLDRLDHQVTDAQSRYEQLRLEVARLESPTRVVAAAHELGMVQPETPIYLSPDAADVATAVRATGDATTPGGDGDPSAGRNDWETMKSTVDGTP